MSIFERRRLLAGLLKMEMETEPELEITVVLKNGCIIIYPPEADAYLAIPQSVFGIESDHMEELLLEGHIVSPDMVLQVGTNETDELSMDGVLASADTIATNGVLEIPYAIGDGLVSITSGELLKYLKGFAKPVLEITSTVGKRRAQAIRGSVKIAEIGCDAAITSTIKYTTTENEAGGLTYDITTDVYEETDGVYVIGGSDGS